MKFKKLTAIFVAAVMCFSSVTTANATETTYSEEAMARAALPIESNDIENWPDGPVCYAQSAILMEASTGTILYEKNSHEQLYPASITKIMTGLLAVENSSLDETVTFSHNSVFGIPSGSSIVGGIDEGDQYSMEFCLYGLMLLSGNETAMAIAEHVAGTTEAFADMMNKKAAELGCLNTHFANPHGLHDPNHYTSAYDMALISQAALQNPDIKKFMCTATYNFPPTSKGEIRYDNTNHHKMMQGGAYEYEGCIGGKTGYTTDAGSTLVTFAERDGMTLICVVLKEDKPCHWTDTATLLDYGFQNFQKINISENEKNFSFDNANFFQTESNVFGNTKPLISVNKSGSIILPKNASFEDATPTLNFDKADESANVIATLDYSFNNHFVGYTTIDLVKSNDEAFQFSANSSSMKEGESVAIDTENKTVTVGKTKNSNNKLFLFLFIGIIVLALLVLVSLFILKKFKLPSVSSETYVGKKLKPEKKSSRSKRRKYPSKYKNLKF